jgi:hypothetical protein
MASFSDSPLEIIQEIIDNLQDDLLALRACSQTCQSLFPLCRKYIFRTVSFTPRSWSARHQGLPRYITLFGTLLDSHSEIADYVQNLVYRLELPDFTDEDVPRILEKFHRIQSFRFIGGDADWRALYPTLRESLSHIIHLRSLTCLEISYLKNFPINTFIPCINLTDLTLSHITSVVVKSNGYEHECFVSDVVPQLRSFTFDLLGGRYAQSLVEARRSKDLPVLDFSQLHTLSVNVDEHSDLAAVHTIMRVTEKLEILDYSGMLPEPSFISQD